MTLSEILNKRIRRKPCSTQQIRVEASRFSAIEVEAKLEQMRKAGDIAFGGGRLVHSRRGSSG